MAQLNVRRQYAAQQPLLKDDLDAFIDDIETFVNVTRINNDNIQDAGITASSKIIPNTLHGEKLLSGAVTTAKITDANVTTAKIADDAVTSVKITDSVITAAKMADNSVTLTKVADGTITFNKMSEGYTTTSSSATVTSGGTLLGYKFAELSVTTSATDTCILIEGIAGYFNIEITTSSPFSGGAGFTSALDGAVSVSRKPDGSSTATILAGCTHSDLIRIRSATTYTYGASFPASAFKFILPAPGAGTFIYSLYYNSFSSAITSTVGVVFSARKVLK